MIDMHSPPHPGSILKELYLDGAGVSVTRAAKAFGISRKTLSLIINGHAGISPQTALILSQAFPTSSAELWLKLQLQYDLWQVRQKEITPILPLWPNDKN